LRIIDRINKIREQEDLNKSKFEKRINKSTGYINMLEKRNGQPGADVILDIVKAFPDYSLNWLMTGEGSMLKTGPEKINHEANEDAVPYSIEKETTLLAVRDDLKRDLRIIHESLIKGVETISDGVFHGLRDQQKILKFIEQLNPEEINGATRNLNKFLQEQKD
jgi:transcriptional regulator with XRE-family HTH domain